MKCLASVLVLVLIILLPANTAQAEPDIRKFDPGSYVTGPKFKGKDLKNRVIVIEYWGITCGPCLKAIPHTTELAKKYGHDKLAIIANQSWNATDKQCKEVWLKYAKNDMVMVTNGGEMPDFRPRSFPTTLIFDHNLKLVWQGHPASMDAPLKKAIDNLPEEKSDAIAFDADDVTRSFARNATLLAW